MLVLARRKGEAIVIGRDIRITVLRVTPRSVRLGIEAPRNVTVYREELLLRLPRSGCCASASLPNGRTEAPERPASLPPRGACPLRCTSNSGRGPACH